MFNSIDLSRPDNTVTPTNRSPDDYCDIVRHALRHRLVVPRPQSPAERKMLATTFAEVCHEMGERDE